MEKNKAVNISLCIAGSFRRITSGMNSLALLAFTDTHKTLFNLNISLQDQYIF